MGGSADSNVRSEKRGSFRDSMSDFFKKANASFKRSDGNRGATVKNLRGVTGAEFEAQCLIHRAVDGGIFGCCGNPFVARYLIIKGPFCFVFVKEDSSSPQYAIKLEGLVASKPQHTVLHHWTVLLRTVAVGDVEYELSFDKEDTAQKFVTVVEQQAAAAATEETRKRLGHDHLLNKRASVRFAESVAIAKEKDQPEKPAFALDMGGDPAF